MTTSIGRAMNAGCPPLIVKEPVQHKSRSLQSALLLCRELQFLPNSNEKQVLNLFSVSSVVFCNKSNNHGE